MYIGWVRTQAPPTDDLATNLVAASARLVRLVGAVADVPLSVAQTRVLAVLRDGGPSRITELARRERCAQPSMSALVDRLAQAGYITRRHDTADGRAVLVDITAAGRAQLVAARQSMAAALAPRLARLGEDERARLRSCAGMLTTLMEDLSD